MGIKGKQYKFRCIPKSNNISLGINDALDSAKSIASDLRSNMKDLNVRGVFDGVLELQDTISGEVVSLSKSLDQNSKNIRELGSIVDPINTAIIDVGNRIIGLEEDLKLSKTNLENYNINQNISNLCLNTLEEAQGAALCGLKGFKGV